MSFTNQTASARTRFRAELGELDPPKRAKAKEILAAFTNSIRELLRQYSPEVRLCEGCLLEPRTAGRTHPAHCHYEFYANTRDGTAHLCPGYSGTVRCLGSAMRFDKTALVALDATTKELERHGLLAKIEARAS